MNAYARFDELSPFEGRLPDDLFEHLVLLGEIVVPHTVRSGLAGQEGRNRLEILWVQRIPDKQHVSFGCCEILSGVYFSRKMVFSPSAQTLVILDAR